MARISGLLLVALTIVVAATEAQYNPYNQVVQPRYNPDYYGRRYAILRQNHVQDIDGHYAFSYDTENGISVAEEGRPVNRGPYGRVEAVQGRFSYTAPNGQPISVQYVADENGFRASGAHLPTPPPIPAAIQRALAYNAAHPEEDHDPYARSKPF
ncbi:endocuticle structural glycoprotein SgAbd-2-like [Trichogramma pretiosum]|uniref:endocuticle structural glycoprotein SgAbd-2-like n=1 Tax=Trichogramma pretiosum TaxID=7493 RepID=UPI0006C9CFFA|nr:endocuticle structural glycoprotein SgAbd-2-like [Trichogramma pretiosum]